MVQDFIAQIRQADWLSGKSLKRYLLFVFLLALLPVISRLGTSYGLLDKSGLPLGGDFISFYAASRLALAGHAADAWRPDLHHAAESAVFNRDLGVWAFFYPPPYLLVCLPLALLTYGWSLAVATVSTGVAAVTAVHGWLRRVAPNARIGLLPLLACPGLWLNMSCGQNAALITAIAALGCLLMPTNPVSAGLVLGALIIKPQLAVALPFLLVASGRWKTVLAMGVSAAGLCLIAFFVVGADGYAAFLKNSALAREALDQGRVPYYAMQSAFGGLKILGASNLLAYAGQGLVTLVVLVRAAYVAFRYRPDALAIGALMVSTTLLLTPFILDYDLLLSVVPLGWLVMRGVADGFRPWEKITAILVFILPLYAMGAAGEWHLPLAVLTLAALFVMIDRRISAGPIPTQAAWSPETTRLI